MPGPDNKTVQVGSTPRSSFELKLPQLFYKLSVEVSSWTILKLEGFNLNTPNPAAVLVQVNSHNNDNPTNANSYVVTVNETAKNHIILKILRVDAISDKSETIGLSIVIFDGP